MSRPWISCYDPGVPADVPESPHGLYGLLTAVVSRFPDTAALSYFGRDISYWRLKHLCDAFATALYRRELGPGKRVALLLPNCPQFVISLLGTLRAGATVVPLPPELSAAELASVLQAIPCHLAVVLDSHVAVVKAATDTLPLVVSSLRDYLPPPLKLLYPARHVVGLSLEASPDAPDVRFLPLVKRAKPVNFLLESPSPEAVLFVDDPTRPHGAALTSVALATNARQLSLWPGRMLKRGREKLLAAHPLHRFDGMVGCLGLALAAAATLILTSRVRTEDIMPALTTFEPDVLVGPASLFEELAVRATPLPPRRPITRSLRWALSTAGSLPTAARQLFEEHADAPLIEALASAATGFSHAEPLLRKSEAPGALLPLPGVDSICEARGLAVGGPQIMSHWVPSAPDGGPHVANGWVHTTSPFAMAEQGWLRRPPDPDAGR